MDSDCELQASDTLRCESESDPEENHSDAMNVRSPSANPNDPTVIDSVNGNSRDPGEYKRKQENVPHLSKWKNKESETQIEKDDAQCGVKPDSVVHLRWKTNISNIIDSDSDDDPISSKSTEDQYSLSDPTKTKIRHLKKIHDEESDSDAEVNSKKKDKSRKKSSKMRSKERKRRNVDFDSDKGEAMSNSESSGPVVHKGRTKKIIKKKIIFSKTETAQDILANLNLFFSDEDSKQPHSFEKQATSSSSSDEESREASSSKVKGNKKMTNHEAMEEKRIIQSESQRMKREMTIDVPYHRARARTFEEFLARKAICKADTPNNCIPKTKLRDMSMKMTSEQLATFARHLKEREEESKKFYQPEISDEESEQSRIPNQILKSIDLPQLDATIEGAASEDKIVPSSAEERLQQSTIDANPLNIQTNEVLVDAVTEVETNADEIGDKIPGVSKQTQNDTENQVQTQKGTEICGQKKKSEVDYDVILDKPKTTTATTQKNRLLATLEITSHPHLRNPGMAIELDGDDSQPKPLSGIEILFERLAKCGGGKQNVTSTAQVVSILSSDGGDLKLNNVSLLTNDEQQISAKDSIIPGAAMLKVQQILKEKIDTGRREAMKKREEECPKTLDDENMENSEGEQEEELSDDFESETSEDEDEDGGYNVAGQHTSNVNHEAINDDEEYSSSNSNSEESEDKCEEMIALRNTVKKNRIVAFQDSEDEVDVPTLKPCEKAQVFDQTNKTPTNETALETEFNKPFEEQDDNLILHWKDDEEESNGDNVSEDDLMALCSGGFTTQAGPDDQSLSNVCLVSTTQKQFPENQNKKSLQQASQVIYTQADQLVGESQLMEMCSGSFETQKSMQIQENTVESSKIADAAKKDTYYISDRKMRLESSAESDNSDSDCVKKVRKRRKRKHLHISDDDEEETEKEQADEPETTDEKKINEKKSSPKIANTAINTYFDYDSEENEIEVTLPKKGEKQMVKNFLEIEAELSESEWGSADEDEKGLDQYDIEMGDEDEYDQNQLQQELEKLHHRQMLDRDHREVEKLKEIYMEDEENEAVWVRQFRWKNAENTINLDYDKKTHENENEEENEEAKDEETELIWRKMRHERDKMLKEKNLDETETDFPAATLLNTTDTTNVIGERENNQSVLIASTVGKKRLTIVKKQSTTPSSTKEEKPFLISSSSIAQGSKASFLTRDEKMLNKLADLIKANPENESSNTVVPAKSRNFVFAALSPAIEKTAKRVLDSKEAEESNDAKKAKTSSNKPDAKQSLFLDSLM
ncbi:claspin [Anopheles bellator]|uniref:claspin n=1 Tax=Anopheles bellator TaxID=139047 RepID=UPI0026497B81|nr:claspin [Anopheles bellator]